MTTFTDISYNDNGTVNSVLVGCSVDGCRALYIDVAEARHWAKMHSRLHANDDTKAPTRIRTSNDQFLAALGDQEVTAHELSQRIGTASVSVNQRLNLFVKSGELTRTKIGRKYYYKAAASHSDGVAA